MGRESWDMVQSGGVGWREREKIHPYEINRSMFSGLSLTNVLGNQRLKNMKFLPSKISWVS